MMRKHIAYLIAGIIAGLILGMLVSAGGQEKEEESENIKIIRAYLDPNALTPLVLLSMNDLIVTQYKIIDEGIQEITDPIIRGNLLNYWIMQMQLYDFVQNHHLLLQNMQIIELLEEIRDKE